MNKTNTTQHHNMITVYFRNDEVTFGGRTYICCPPSMIHSCIGRHPSDTKYWRTKPLTLDERIAEIHERATRQMPDHELLREVLSPEASEKDFLKAVKAQMFKRQSN
jgi:hypothetical protein